jgi:hypothetical protein
MERAEIVDHLKHTPGKHLVIVRYTRLHNLHREWVFNGAEIDSAKILWARDIDAAQNEKLFDYFRDRQIWLVQPDEREEQERRLKPYPRSETPSLP